MSATRFGRAQKATALVPLALLSAAWTASLAGVGAPTVTAASSQSADQGLPDGASVPTTAIEAPASVSAPDSVAPGLEGVDPVRAVSTSSTSAIPSVALAAYQRAETVINSADKACNLTWQLVAAIGRVESDHGRYAGNQLDDQGLAVPGIFGPALDGSKNTQAISDTDAGQFDTDPVWDRAVGPMQFIPSTWSVVGVDADGDGKRNPQDIDDAALASAVYLCSGNDDLSATAGQRAAVFRYNHSSSYVDLVLSIMDSYLQGDFNQVPNSTTSAGYFVPGPQNMTPAGPVKSNGKGKGNGNGNAKGAGGAGNGGGSKSRQPKDDEAVAAAPAQPQAPTSPQPGGGGPSLPVGGGDKDGDSKGGLGIPGAPTVKLPPLPDTGIDPVDKLLSRAEAEVQCRLDGYSALLTPAKFEACIRGYMNG